MEFKNQQAIYLQIADFMLDNILSGSWKNGDRVQSVREMAATVEVNPNTVVRSYSYLQDMGIIFNKRGIGYFVAEDALTRTQKIRRDNFLREELPSLFHAMELLGVNIEELPQLYTQYKSQHLNGNSAS
ncbi:MAG: GntR family transcriptional regulator [Bacteroidia bacterium]